ncbi:ribose-5-phosphate isomerase [Arsenicicoccus sp. oral taxon 190]|uniref:ribose-5-phosphate isomerase n=1 Tax=Arsenicicoccus sp. oral taxon 190 TaxID=1658671 RepID=UPI00067A209C|nr:ribose-5-phosphate isomerase [Arsenicicoccus sp. oral taxon 190]AKT51517.1 ribose 5-phosphate isomerase [Arsenicicoccus sp. oral taxon 190]
MRIHIGADHAALEAKQAMIEHLRGQGHDVVDHGPFVYDPVDDYPVFCLRAAEAVAAEPESLGFVLGGSGNGEQIAANKVKGVRAALAYTPELAQLAREHNDARVCSIGGRFTTPEESLTIADAFVATPFTGEERHARRIAMLERYEQTGELPELPDRAR